MHRLGFGAMRITGDGVWGEPKDREEAKRVLKRLPDLGVNLIDTADAYGPEVSENLIAEALHPYPAGMVIATKGGFTRQGPNKWTVVGRPEYLRQCVEMSLRRLKLEQIDLWQLHRIDPAVPVEDQIGELKKLQKEGKIRHIGLSEVSVKDIERAAKTAKIVSVQNKYNIADRTHEEVLQYCEKNNLGFIPWFPMEAGKLNKPGSSLESGGEVAQCVYRAAGGGVVAAPLAGDAADSGDVVGEASGRECCGGGDQVERYGVADAGERDWEVGVGLERVLLKRSEMRRARH